MRCEVHCVGFIVAGVISIYQTDVSFWRLKMLIWQLVTLWITFMCHTCCILIDRCLLLANHLRKLQKLDWAQSRHGIIEL